MTSSGIGGSNGHLVLEGPLVAKNNGFKDLANIVDGPLLLMAGGLSSRTVVSIAEKIQNGCKIANTGDARALSLLLGRRVKQMTWRSFSVVNTIENISSAMFSPPRHCKRKKPSLLFVFSGQGPQYNNMGKQLFQQWAVFQQSVLEMDALHEQITGKSLINDFGLFGSLDAKVSLPEPWPIALTLPAIAVFQMALFDLLVSLGIVPDAMVGHSAGETAVFYASGAAPKAMAVELAIIRGQIFSSMESLGGSMAAVSCTPDQAQAIILKVQRQYPQHVLEIACYNSPTAVALAGHEVALECALKLAANLGIFGRKIRTAVAIHSSMMEACKNEYVTRLHDLFRRYPGDHYPSIPIYSTLTGKPYLEPIDSQYFWRNTRGQVQFTQAIQSIYETTKSFTAVEISPHPVLSSYLSSMVDDNDVLHTLHRPRDGKLNRESQDILQLCGNILLAGHNCVNFASLTRVDKAPTTLSFPKYPFQKKQFPLYPNTPGTSRQFESRRGPLNHSYLRVNQETHPILGEHIIRGEPIMPAAGFMEMALEFGATTLLDVTMHSILSLSSNSPTHIELNLKDSQWTVHSLLNNSQPGSVKQLHASGYLSHEGPTVHPSLNIAAIRHRCNNHISSDFYDRLSYFSSYGPHMQRVTNMYYNSYECLLSLRGMDGILTKDGAYVLHPAILDSCIQVCGQRLFHGNFCHNSYYLPAHLDSLIIHKTPRPYYFPAHLYAHIILQQWSPGMVTYDITLVDSYGAPLVTLNGLTTEEHSLNTVSAVTAPLEVVQQPANTMSTEGRFLVVFRLNNSSELLHSIFTTIFQDNSCTIYEVKLPSCSSQGPFSKENSFVLFYSYGQEDEIQWEFSGFNVSQKLDIWLIATDHSSGSALWGFARALRQEYLCWTIHAVMLPFVMPEETWTAWLHSIPACAAQELDIMFGQDGTATVPRLLPLLACRNNNESLLGTPKLHNSYDVGIEVLSYFTVGRVTGFIASVIEPNGHTQLKGSHVAGIYLGPIKASIVVDVTSVTQLPAAVFPIRATAIMGSVVAIAALGTNEFTIASNSRISVLVTHADAIIGQYICQLYAHFGISTVKMSTSARLLDLGANGYRRYDLVVSGYEDALHNTFLKSLLKPKSGRLFSWNGPSCSFVSTLLQTPHTISEAISVVISLSRLEWMTAGSHLDESFTDYSPIMPPLITASPVFDPQGVYILHGGIGSLGVHIALFMYKHGARNIILTSRSGCPKDLFVNRMLHFLQGLDDLTIRISAVDGTSVEDMQEFISSISLPIKGCILLAAVLRDHSFPSLTISDFKQVFAAKTGIYSVLAEVIELQALDFVISFSSVSGIFGGHGQANYSAANTALDGALSLFENSFSFVCPAISDSALMQYGEKLSDLGRKSLLQWSFTSQEMIQWFSDAIYRFQQGQRFALYVPQLNWEVLDQNRGVTGLAQHLVPDYQSKDIATDDILEKMTEMVKKVLNISSNDFSPHIPFTSYGIDSLSASQLSFSLRSVIDISQIQLLGDISLNDIYQRFMTAEVQANTRVVNLTSTITSPTSGIQETLAKYMNFLPRQSSTNFSSPPLESPSVVLLTGSTGALGCAILAHLISEKAITHIFALSRKHAHVPLVQRQRAAFLENGYAIELLSSSRLTLVEGDLSLPNFGMDMEIFKRAITHIIHNAWKVNFSEPLSAYENLLYGTCKLIDFASSVQNRALPALSYISTVGVKQGRDGEVLLEEQLQDSRLVISTGYAESKWVAEQIVCAARSLCSLNASVIRVGLLSGSINGHWDTSHWFPSLVESGHHVGCLPDGDELVSWLPTDMAAAAVVELRHSTVAVLNVVHPNPVKWGTIMAELSGTLHLPLVPYVEWFGCIEGISREQATLSAQKPIFGALKLLDMFRYGVKPHPGFESMGLLPEAVFTQSLQLSSTLKAAQKEQIGTRDIQKWVAKWQAVQFLLAV
ncbi:hypothetical protein F5051DRAFT_328254 [Lentinula edodes]|nr:hypothetical protein F5051DRAFT_328254 [Lentinula edodes]